MGSMNESKGEPGLGGRRAMNNAQTTTTIAEVYLLIIQHYAFHHRVLPGFEIRLALTGAREWPKAPSEPRAGAV